MKSNEHLQKEVQDAIKWEPLLHAAEIGVTAKNGIVTLTGTVDSYAKKMEAEDATKAVNGVKAVVEKITVSFSSMNGNTDEKIASEIISAFQWNWSVPTDAVKVKVENGWVTLDGALHWNYQREGAKKAVKNLAGVKGISNNITIQSETEDTIERSNVESALRRNWSINDSDIRVGIMGHKLTLSGTVSSLYQKDEATRIAWNAPGVWLVENDLVVEYD